MILSNVYNLAYPILNKINQNSHWKQLKMIMSQEYQGDLECLKDLLIINYKIRLKRKVNLKVINPN